MASQQVRFQCTMLIVIATILFLSPSGRSQVQQLQHWSGVNVAPVYEGFDVNADGTYNLWFGYLNRNWEQTLDIPVGPNNRIEPGDDRGQPTHFMARRHKDVFKVVVPHDFGDKQLVWTLMANGRTDRVAGTLNPMWQIDRLRTTRGGNSQNVNSNTPPKADVGQAERTIAQSDSLALSISATDDGLPKRQGVSVGMMVEWAKFRGPGSVTFVPAEAKLSDGRATATARFGEPGEYILQAVVDDGSGETAGNFGYHCCWTNAQVKVHVNGGPRLTAAPPARPAGAPPTQVTFSRDVALILQKSCQSCHHPGTGVPMSLMTYQEVRPWARSIKSRVSAREMPPWHLDKSVGIRKYKNDISLSEAEIATLTAWVDQDAPQGNPADLPPSLTFRPEDEWFIGKPDLTLTTDDFTMYANGPDWWIDQFADTDLTEDRWIKAVQIKPSNRRIAHHSVAYALDPEAADGGQQGGSLTEYAPGKFGQIFGENTGKLLKAGTRIRFDMHYNAAGEVQSNHTTIAFVLYPKGFVPKYQVRSISFRNLPNDDLDIPPNTVARTDGYFRLPNNARIDSFQPHMHMRGKAMTLEAIGSNNRPQILSSVDHFDFNWHVNYVYADDVAPLLAAGTMLHLIGLHDNTAANRRNPDPSMWAGYGERSVDDMLQVWLDVVYLDDADFRALVAQRESRRVSLPTGGQ